MGKVIKGIGSVVGSVGKGIFGAVKGAVTSLPRIGAGFVAGGPIGAALAGLPGVIGGVRGAFQNQNPIQSAMGQTGNMTPWMTNVMRGMFPQLNLGGGGWAGGQTAPTQNQWGFYNVPGALPEDYRSSQQLTTEAGRLLDLESELGKRDTELFNLLKGELASGGGLSAEETAKFGGTVGEAIGRQLFGPGGAVEQGQFGAQGQAVSTNFGTSSGALQNAYAQIRERAYGEMGDKGIAASAQFAPALASVASNRFNVLGALSQSSSGERLGALSDYLTTIGAANRDLFSRGFGREQFDFGKYAFEKSMPGFGQRVLEPILTGTAQDVLPGLINKGLGAIWPSVFGQQGAQTPSLYPKPPAPTVQPPDLSGIPNLSYWQQYRTTLQPTNLFSTMGRY